MTGKLANTMLAAAYPHPDVGTSLLVFGALALTLIASATMFWMLTERVTSGRQRVSLAEWAREEGFRLRFDLPGRPAPFEALRGDGLHVQTALTCRQGIVSLLQIGNWHLLTHKIAADWKPTGLRPALAADSVLDRFSLESFPLVGPSERFVLFGVDPASALSLSKSSARALLPPDVGLLLHGHSLVLDFSSRPFDVVELNRMRAIAGQIVKHLATR
jgi:hypothetical protein